MTNMIQVCSIFFVQPEHLSQILVWMRTLFSVLFLITEDKAFAQGTVEVQPLSLPDIYLSHRLCLTENYHTAVSS